MGSFEPPLVKKQQTRFPITDDKILRLYANGMTTQEIAATFKEMYDADVSATLNSRVTDAVIDQVIDWQSRPLNEILIACIDGLKDFPDAIHSLLEHSDSAVYRPHSA